MSCSIKASLLGLLLLFMGGAVSARFDCDPCIERNTYKIQAIVHGSETDPFWLQIQAAMVQAAKDVDVNFDMSFMDMNYPRMAQTISTAAKDSDALIVSIPNSDVQAAVDAAIQGGTPVFGLQSGYEFAQAAGLKSFIGMDDYQGGKVAAEQFLNSTGGTISRALFVEHTLNGNSQNSQQRRHAGFDEKLTGNGGVVDQVSLDDFAQTKSILEAQFNSCPYDAVLLGTESDQVVSLALAALEAKGCSNTMLGTFGTSIGIHQAVSAGKLKFAISQQSYLQGAMSLVHAAMYVTTGKALAPSSESEYGMLQSGPEVITADNAYTDTFQVCEADGFPVCPNDRALDGSKSKCDCTSRPKMKIAGVLHAVTTDAFWDIVYTAANQAADDYGVELELDRMEPDTADVLHFKMATAIEKLCQEGIDGIFVTIPSEAVLEAIELCMKLNVPVVSINAGPDFSRDLGLQHHLGMVEFNAGYLAGKQMMEKASITKAVCLDHAPGNVVLIDRCGGFKKAIEEAGITYLGEVTVPDDNAQLHVSTVETFIKESNNDDWSGLGILLGGGPQHEPGNLLKDSHPEATFGAFDTSDFLYDGVSSDKILFGMDQGPYLQGYLPIPLLTWQAQTMQNSVNHLIETGPDFVFSSPSKEQQICEANHFKSCEYLEVSTTSLGDGPGIPTGSRSSESGSGNEGAIIGLSIVAIVCLFAIIFLFYRMNMLKNYLHRLEEQGQDAPKLTAGDYLTSAYMPVEKIVGNKAGATERTDPSEPEAC